MPVFRISACYIVLHYNVMYAFLQIVLLSSSGGARGLEPANIAVKVCLQGARPSLPPNAPAALRAIVDDCEQVTATPLAC
eukprot:COSAG04_NODE_9195_length_888_cov_1.306717_2_plen_80_part_00